MVLDPHIDAHVHLPAVRRSLPLPLPLPPSRPSNEAIAHPWPPMLLASPLVASGSRRGDVRVLARITPRRAAVLHLVCGHHTNREIAAALGVAPHTAKRAIDQLRTLTGCRSKGELARWWATYQMAWSTLMEPLASSDVTKL